ncbi:hypothetical protein V8E55_007883 [Tylopilus felleus]
MRSLLSQLLQQFHRHVVNPGDLIDELVEVRNRDDPPASDVVLLARYVSFAAKQFYQRPFLVVDALDECTDLQDLLDALPELRKSAVIRLFVTSRPLSIIKNGLSSVKSIDEVRVVGRYCTACYKNTGFSPAAPKHGCYSEE